MQHLLSILYSRLGRLTVPLNLSLFVAAQNRAK
jgi:hypothetical protein